MTAGLRGDDYLPPEVLNQLPSAPAPPPHAEANGETTSLRKSNKKAAAERRARAAAAAAPRDGMPRVVRKVENVEIAVLPAEGAVRQHPRIHAPVKANVRDFLQQQLHGDRHRRVPAATQQSLKPSSGRYGAASNFASVPLSAPSSAQGEGDSKRKKRRASETPAVGGYSTLERMAAKIMRKKR